MEFLPIEIIQIIAFMSGLDFGSAYSLALTSKTMYEKILGPVGDQNKYDLAQLCSLLGAGECMKRHMWRASKIAISREIGSLDKKYYVSKVRCFVFPITMAVISDKTEIVEMILSRGVTMVREIFVMNTACRMASLPTVQVLMQYTTCNMQGPVLTAIQYDNTEVAIYLLENVDLDCIDQFCLSNACVNGNVDIVRVMMQNPRFDAFFKSGMSFCCACTNGHLEVVKLMMTHPMFEMQPRFLRRAYNSEKYDVFYHLLDNYDGPNKSTIKRAADEGHRDVVFSLLWN